MSPKKKFIHTADSHNFNNSYYNSSPKPQKYDNISNIDTENTASINKTKDTIPMNEDLTKLINTNFKKVKLYSNYYYLNNNNPQTSEV